MRHNVAATLSSYTRHSPHRHIQLYAQLHTQQSVNETNKSGRGRRRKRSPACQLYWSQQQGQRLAVLRLPRSIAVIIPIFNRHSLSARSNNVLKRTSSYLVATGQSECQTIKPLLHFARVAIKLHTHCCPDILFAWFCS